MFQSLFEQTCQVRDELYASIGKVEPDVMAPIVNPAFTGGPRWPALRQAFSIIHRGDNTIVISNGLADPFEDAEEINTGFGIEIYAETKEAIEGSVSQSALFELVYAVAQQAAHSGQMADLIRQYGVITMELYADDCGLHQYKNEDGMVGVMIGVEHPELPGRFNFPGGEIVLAAVQVLTPEELDYVAEARAEGRKNLHEKFKAAGIYHFFSTNRPSLIANKVEEKALALPPSVVEVKTEKPWWKFW